MLTQLSHSCCPSGAKASSSSLRWGKPTDTSRRHVSTRFLPHQNRTKFLSQNEAALSKTVLLGELLRSNILTGLSDFCSPLLHGVLFTTTSALSPLTSTIPLRRPLARPPSIPQQARQPVGQLLHIPKTAKLVGLHCETSSRPLLRTDSLSRRPVQNDFVPVEAPYQNAS